MLMHHLLYRGAEWAPEKVALRWVDRELEYTYAEAVEQMERFAGALNDLGAGRGDRVSVVAHNGMDYLMALFGCWRIGAIPALVNVKLAGELDYYFSDHTPTVVIFTHDAYDQVTAAASAVSSVRALVCMDKPMGEAKDLGELLRAGHKAPDDPADETAIAHLSYTSGTSGKPKGACLMHEPTMRATNCIAERLRVRTHESSFGPSALSSSYQLVGNILPTLHRTGTVNVMSKWTQETGYDAIEKTGSALLIANPTLLTELLHESKKRGKTPSSLRVGVSGGGPVPLPLKKAWRDELKLPLAESYGQSELGGFVALGFPDLEPDERLAPIGIAPPDKEVKILNASDEEVPVGEVGQMCLRGGYMWGYWNREEQTAKTLAGGWLHTGDAGCIDHNGYITMRGRFSELITVASRTWFPRDVEEALLECEGVTASSVVAVADDKIGDRPIAFVVCNESLFDMDKMKAAITGLVPYDLQHLQIVPIDQFPMTPTGKIAKAELKELAQEKFQ